MGKLPEEVKEILQGGHQVWVATVGEDGWPNVAIKGSGGLVDEDHIYFADMFSRKTRENLLYSSRVAVGLYDHDRRVAVQIKGVADMIQSGELFEEVSRKLEAMERGFPPLTYVVRILVQSVWDMSGGPNAGQRLA